MLVPRLFDEVLLDDYARYPRHEANGMLSIMHTDVEEKDDSYVLKMNLPGFRKEDVNIELQEGTLIVRAVSHVHNEKKDKEGRLIRSERFNGNCMRSFYVGEDVKQEDIRAKFENGVLILTFPKKQPEVKVEDSHTITIEG